MLLNYIYIYIHYITSKLILLRKRSEVPFFVKLLFFNVSEHVS